MTLTEFLLARIAEDEAMAKAACQEGGGRWYAVPSRRADEGDTDWFVRPEHPANLGGGNPEFSMVAAYLCTIHDDEPTQIDDAHHMARHSPARVLAECEAKRRIVGEHDGNHDCVRYYDPEGNRDCLTLRALAAVYSDHPDYRGEWKP